jgi:hypothetical protein
MYSEIRLKGSTNRVAPALTAADPLWRLQARNFEGETNWPHPQNPAPP